MDDISKAEAEVSLRGFLKEVREAAEKWSVDGILKMELRIPVSTDMGEYRRSGIEAAYPFVTQQVSEYPEYLDETPTRVRWSKNTRKTERWEI